MSTTFYMKMLLMATLLSAAAYPFSRVWAQDAQPVKHAVQAARYCQSGQYDEALNAIQLALATEEEKDALYTWYVNGFIHKEIYKNKESAMLNSPHREMAVEAFLKSKQLTDGQADVYNNNAALKYLANTYFNDAITLASQFSLDHELAPDSLLNRCEKIRMEINGDMADIGNFFKQKAQRYYAFWLNDPCMVELNEKSTACYQLAIDNNSSDCDSYYNKAVARYTLAQKARDESINACYINMNAEALIHSAIKTLHDGEKHCGQQKSISKALHNCYSALGDEEKASLYQPVQKH